MLVDMVMEAVTWSRAVLEELPGGIYSMAVGTCGVCAALGSDGSVADSREEEMVGHSRETSTVPVISSMEDFPWKMQVMNTDHQIVCPEAGLRFSYFIMYRERLYKSLHLHTGRTQPVVGAAKLVGSYFLGGSLQPNGWSYGM